MIYHKDWNGQCYIKDNNIYRNNLDNENGSISIKINELLIKWDNWEEEYFMHIYDNIYIEKFFYKEIKIYYLISNNQKYICIYNLSNNKFINDDNIFINEKSIIKNDETYENLICNIYISKNDFNNYFYIETVNFNLKKIYILNKLEKIFFEQNNLNNEGKFITENNILYLIWKNGLKKKFLSNIYYETNEIKYENIKILKPNKFIIDNRILFGNITLIKNKIYLSSIYYQVNPWNLENLYFYINGELIKKKEIIEYKNYESVIIIILDLEIIEDKINLEIVYENEKKIFKLNQLKLPKNNIYAMTLFKNDYQLLKKYLEYYSTLGINCFFLYYNDKITDSFMDEIYIINQCKYEIILVEWDYEYWYNFNENEKHHHSQVMAINDSLYILKNFCNYILYNDLDEYIKIENTFNDLIDKNADIDIFEFKCLFCKMGNNLIKYRNFYFEYDEKKIIEGNFWDKFREKNLIKNKNVKLMGVHNAVTNLSDIKLNKLYVSHFYHFINYYEKNRPELMTQYVS